MCEGKKCDGCKCESKKEESLKEELLDSTEEEVQKKVGILDALSAKLIGRKYTAFIIATIAFFIGKLPPEHWAGITAIFLGVQGVLDWKRDQ